MKTIPYEKIRKKWVKNPAFIKAHQELAPEFELAGALIEARLQSGLSQEEIAKRMGTTQSAIARLESGRISPRSRSLERYARALGMRIRLELVPLTARGKNKPVISRVGV
jgi:transcriptional regulator with XRE-family HTH domain